MFVADPSEYTFAGNRKTGHTKQPHGDWVHPKNLLNGESWSADRPQAGPGVDMIFRLGRKIKFPEKGTRVSKEWNGKDHEKEARRDGLPSPTDALGLRSFVPETQAGVQ